MALSVEEPDNRSLYIRQILRKMLSWLSWFSCVFAPEVSVNIIKIQFFKAVEETLEKFSENQLFLKKSGKTVALEFIFGKFF